MSNSLRADLYHKRMEEIAELKKRITALEAERDREREVRRELAEALEGARLHAEVGAPEPTGCAHMPDSNCDMECVGEAYYHKAMGKVASALAASRKLDEEGEK